MTRKEIIDALADPEFVHSRDGSAPDCEVYVYQLSSNLE